MTTSVTGICNKKPGSGFTLLEVLVVIFIVGIMLGALMLSLQDRPEGEQARREAQRIKALVDLAREEAILNTAILGIRFDHTSYQFMQLTGNKWALLDDRILRKRELDETLNLEFEQVEDAEPIKIDESKKDKDDEDEEEEEEEPPQVAIYPTGELTPFRLIVETVGSPLAVSIEARTSGKLTIENIGEHLVAY